MRHTGATGAVREDDWRVTALGLAWLRSRLEDHISVLRAGRPAGAGVDSETMSDLEADWLLRELPGHAAPSAASEEARAAYDAARDQMRKAGSPAAIDRLSALFGLAPFDEDILLLAAAPRLDAAFAALFGYAHDRLALQSASLHLAAALFLPGGGGVEAGNRLSSHAPLRRYALLALPADGLGALSPLTVDERIAGWLAGWDATDLHLSRWLRPLADRPLPARFAGRIQALAADIEAKGDAAAILIGPRRCGRRAAAVALAREFDLSPVELDIGAVAADGAPAPAQLALLAREARLAGLALVIDLDSGGPPDSGEKPPARRASADDLVTGLEAPLFLLSENAVRGAVAVPVVQLDALSPSDRAALWRDAVGPAAQGDDAGIEALAEQFAVGPGDIGRIAAAGNVTNVGDLWQASRRQGRTGLDGLAERIEPRFDWDDIVLPAGVTETLRAIVAQGRWRGTVYGRWGFGRKLVRGRGITALFAGASGVGKTMAAEVISAALELDLLRVDLAGVVSKYIGETEKNLRRVFDGAEAAGAVLFFDEADALFGKRGEVKDSHDRYANVEVSYLLQRMEAFHGVSILATNLKAHLDTAFLRRLRYVVDFPFPDASLRREIWARSFPAEAPTGKLDFDRLSRIEMAGGSIMVAAVNAAFLAAAAGTAIQMEHVAAAAESELRKHGKEQRLTWLLSAPPSG